MNSYLLKKLCYFETSLVMYYQRNQSDSQSKH